MKSKLTVIYIPGLGGQKLIDRQGTIMRSWRNASDVHIIDTKWHTPEPYQQKYQRIIADVDKILEESDRVVLYGVSAGASIATTVFSERTDQIEQLKLIAGKIHGPEKIGPRYRKSTPALFEAVSASTSATNKLSSHAMRITTYRPLIDLVVALEDMLIKDSKTVRMLAPGHVLGIAAALLFYARPRSK